MLFSISNRTSDINDNSFVTVTESQRPIHKICTLCVFRHRKVIIYSNYLCVFIFDHSEYDEYDVCVFFFFLVLCKLDTRVPIMYVCMFPFTCAKLCADFLMHPITDYNLFWHVNRIRCV